MFNAQPGVGIRI